MLVYQRVHMLSQGAKMNLKKWELRGNKTMIPDQEPKHRHLPAKIPRAPILVESPTLKTRQSKMLDCLTNGKWPIYRWISQSNLHSQKKNPHIATFGCGGVRPNSQWLYPIIPSYIPIVLLCPISYCSRATIKKKKGFPLVHNFCGLRSSLPTCRRFPPGPGSSRGTRNGLCASVRHLGGVDLQKMMDIRIYTLCFFQHSHGKRHMNIDDKKDDLPI